MSFTRRSSVFLGGIALLLACAVFTDTAVSGMWYRGDLHAHSEYSDGDSSVAEMIGRAESLGLDFFVLTDHDTSLGGEPQHWRDPDYFSTKMVLLYGMEWTTPHGHANVWAAEPFSYDALWQANRSRDPQTAVSAAHEAPALFSINHPASAIFSLPWEYLVPEGVDAIEVWNSLYRLPSLNRWAGHRFWDNLLRQGRRIPGVGGSDAHMLKGWMSRFWGPGNPTTWVYANSLTAKDILAGITAGHVAISYAPEAVRAELSADDDGDGVDDYLCGDTIEAHGQVLTFRARLILPDNEGVEAGERAPELDRDIVAKLAEGSLRMTDLPAVAGRADMPLYLVGVFKNGSLFRVFMIIGNRGSCTFRDVAAGVAYYRIEVIGIPSVAPLHHLLYGRVIALTNPIYVDGQ
ncbi:MAG: CehA/McbA family metallohydrolase [Desulfobacterota bacterium]|nr:CehA/McbA family metallohydrolase [Thermodesulfobacteriota bacterium]